MMRVETRKSPSLGLNRFHLQLRRGPLSLCLKQVAGVFGHKFYPITFQHLLANSPPELSRNVTFQPHYAADHHRMNPSLADVLILEVACMKRFRSSASPSCAVSTAEKNIGWTTFSAASS